MKKLNKTQKNKLKNDLLKGLNIFCYVVTGLSFLLGCIIGIKSCSDKRKSNVTTTPVVTDTIRSNNRVNDALIGRTTTFDETVGYYDFYDYINGKTYTADDTSFVGVTYPNYNRFYSTYTYNQYLLRYRTRSASYQNQVLFHITGDFDDGNGLDLSFDNDAYSIQYINSTTLKFNLSNGNGYTLDFSRGAVDGRYHFTIVFNYYSVMSASNQYLDIAKGIYTTLNALGIVYNVPSNTIDRSYYLGQYLTPYTPLGKSTDWLGFESVDPYNNPYTSYYPLWQKVFDGEFVSNGQTFTTIYVQYLQFDNLVSTQYGGSYLYFRQLLYSNKYTDVNVAVWSSNVDTFDNTSDDYVQGSGGYNIYDDYRYWCNDPSYMSVFIKSVYSDTNPIIYRSQSSYLTITTELFNNDAIPDGQGNSDYTGDIVGDYDAELQNAWNSVFGLLGMTFNALGGFFNISIMGVSLGTFMFIPFVCMTIIFVVWLIKR